MNLGVRSVGSMIRIREGLSITESEIQERFIRASGPARA